jgi:sugar lactone lactonase YvrE
MWPTLQQPWYFNNPESVTVDSSGFVYVVDTWNHRIKKFTSDGQMVTSWGGEGSGGGEFNSPKGIAIDSSGYVYVVDALNFRVQKFTSDGRFVTTWGNYGTGEQDFFIPTGIAIDDSDTIYVVDSGYDKVLTFTSDGQFVRSWGGPGSGEGEFNGPTSIAIDSNGYAYVVDSVNSRIQKFTSDGQFVGEWGQYGSGDGEFNNPQGVAVDSEGYVYVTDAINLRIQKFTADGQFIAQWGDRGSGEGQFAYPMGIGIDERGYLYVTDSVNCSIEKFTLDGQSVSSWASSGGGEGQFSRPTDIAVDQSGAVYVVDSINFRVQKFSSQGQLLTTWGSYGTGDGEFSYPQGIGVDNSGFVYVTDVLRHDVQKFTLDGEFVTSWGSEGSGSGELKYPTDIAIDINGFVYVVESVNHRVQKFTSDGQFVSTWGSFGSEDGEFSAPYGIVLDSNNHVYVTETGTSRIQKFTSEGQFVARWGSTGSGPARFKQPQGMAVDGDDNIYVADSLNHRIQKFTADGQYLTEWGSSGSEPGLFSEPSALALDASGRVFVCDLKNNRIQVFIPVTAPSPGEDREVHKAIIVAGGGPFGGNNLWDATQMCANYAYRALIYQGYTKETIYYLSADTDLDLDGNGMPDDVDGDATNGNLQTAITSWAQDAEDLFIYMVDHGGYGTFRMGATELLQASDLDSWLDEAQETIPGTVTLIYDACRSGSFLSALEPPAGKERILATSASANEEAIFGSQGTISFSYLFWGRMFNGDSFYDSFFHATNSLGVTYHQTPLLDGNGNGIGNERADQEAARALAIGNETKSAGDLPVIGRVSPSQTLEPGTSATIYAEDVVDADGISRVWAVITPPGYTSDSPDNPVIDLPTIDLSSVGGNRYEATYGGFTVEGTYNIAIYAADRGGVISLPEGTAVTVEGASSGFEPYHVSFTGFSSFVPGSIGVGDDVPVMVNATNSQGGAVYYQFFYHPDYGTSEYDARDDRWVVVQAFSVDNTCTYRFGSVGRYLVVAWAVSDTSNIPVAIPIIGTTVSVGGDGDEISFTGLSTSLTTVPATGDTVTLIANATRSSGGDIYYKFLHRPDYGTFEYNSLDDDWVTMQDFSTSNTCSYPFASPGSYVVKVWAVANPNNLPTVIPVIGTTLWVSSP